MSIIVTHDGNWLVCDPQVGTVSGATRDEALREVARLKKLLSGKRAA